MQFDWLHRLPRKALIQSEDEIPLETAYTWSNHNLLRQREANVTALSRLCLLLLPLLACSLLLAGSSLAKGGTR